MCAVGRWDDDIQGLLTFPVTGGASSGQWLYWEGCRTRAWKWSAEARVSWIAPERPGRPGRETAHSMRRNSATSMAAFTWHHVPRGMCHVPPREPFEKCCFRAAAQTGSGREPKLSGQKRLGMNCISLENQPRGVKIVAPGGNFIFSAFCPLARTPLNLGTPNLVHGCTWARAIRICTI